MLLSCHKSSIFVKTAVAMAMRPSVFLLQVESVFSGRRDQMENPRRLNESSCEEQRGEVAMALLLADPCAFAPPSSSPLRCGVLVMMCFHDGEMNGGASQVARNSKASSAFFCLRPAGESRHGPVQACAALCSANGRSSSA